MREPPDTSASHLSGSLLLAHPSLRDPHFRRTVVLLSSHDEQGAMGMILNRPLGKTLQALGAEFALGPLAHIPLFEGGPVETDRLTLCAWRFHPEQNGFQLMVGLDPERAIALQSEVGLSFRAFLGYAGWSAGQLDEELKGNAWVPSPIIPNLLDLKQDMTLWRSILVASDSQWRLFVDEPEDPAKN